MGTAVAHTYKIYLCMYRVVDVEKRSTPIDGWPLESHPLCLIPARRLQPAQIKYLGTQFLDTSIAHRVHTRKASMHTPSLSHQLLLEHIAGALVALSRPLPTQLPTVIMSTIASPRDPSSTFRRTNSSQAVATPTSSARPSLDIPRSATSSPSLASGTIPPIGKRNNRAALREYYNLKKNPASASATPPLLEVTDTDSVGDVAETSYSEVPLSEIDADGFDADAYVRLGLRNSSLEELLKTYTRVLGEIRALDAEKKALVYDNYSKLITATETIRKVSCHKTGPHTSSLLVSRQGP